MILRNYGSSFQLHLQPLSSLTYEDSLVSSTETSKLPTLVNFFWNLLKDVLSCRHIWSHLVTWLLHHNHNCSGDMHCAFFTSFAFISGAWKRQTYAGIPEEMACTLVNSTYCIYLVYCYNLSLHYIHTPPFIYSISYILSYSGIRNRSKSSPTHSLSATGLTHTRKCGVTTLTSCSFTLLSWEVSEKRFLGHGFCNDFKSVKPNVFLNSAVAN